MGKRGAGIGNAVSGAVRFGAVSVVVFDTVAFWEARLVNTLGLAGAYVLWTVLFLGGGALSMGAMAPKVPRLVFARWFVLAFLAYAVSWCVAWFAMPNRVGEWVGAVLGSAAMGGLLRTGGLAKRGWWLVSTALLIGNSTGYFSGDILHDLWGRPWGMVAWGATFGLGTGAAMGWAIDSDSNRG